MHFRKKLINSFLTFLPIAIIMCLWDVATTDDNLSTILFRGLIMLAGGTLLGMLLHSLLYYLQNKKEKSSPQQT